ncbi:unnamed protein product [Paramecium pentaurelia]|uniref:Peptidase M14 domain-containing protein n=1 Tax=Paramecium pentaurelia TaxID=43138 RepID=A0A8S1TNB3_9CILI|nr:unnamed protein product [Paramecium pentaurelia]
MIILFQLIPTFLSFQYKGIINQDLNHIKNELINGSLPQGRLAIKDVENLFEELENTTNLVHSQQIGESYLNKTIYSYTLCSNFTKDKPMMLITSLHHSREVASLQMNIYLFLYILWEVKHQKNPYYINMITHNCIMIVPFVNIDGYNEIEYEFNKHYFQPLTRKNLNRTIICNQLDELAGIDLNRNYGYHFGHDNIGSSNDPCDETYRGSAAFSEKETQAIKYVVENYNIKMAMNLHCFGNLWVLPYSYDNEDLDKDGVPYLIYEDFKQNGQFQGNYKIGHAIELVQYTANGEAADWMLSQGIIAISPELGEQTYSNFFQNFYPDQEQTLKLLNTEFPPLIHFINYLPFQPLIIKLYQYNLDDNEKFNKVLSPKQYIVEILCINHGVSNGSNQYFVVSNNVQLIEAYYIDIKYDQIFNRDQIDTSKLNILQINNNTFSTNKFKPRSQIIYFLIYQESNLGGEVKFYFDLYGENHQNTFILKNHQEEQKQLKDIQYHKLYNLLYIGVLIILIITISILFQFFTKKISNKKQQHIIELIEQKPEQIELNVYI